MEAMNHHAFKCQHQGPNAHGDVSRETANTRRKDKTVILLAESRREISLRKRRTTIIEEHRRERTTQIRLLRQNQLT